MKKTFLILAVALMAQFAQAEDITVVIRGNTPVENTESQLPTQVTDNLDTLVVTPAQDASLIYISVKKMNGQVTQYHCVPATCNDLLNVIAPVLPEGYLLEIRDDKGYIYQDFKD